MFQLWATLLLKKLQLEQQLISDGDDVMLWRFLFFMKVSCIHHALDYTSTPGFYTCRWDIISPSSSSTTQSKLSKLHVILFDPGPYASKFFPGTYRMYIENIVLPSSLAADTAGTCPRSPHQHSSALFSLRHDTPHVSQLSDKSIYNLRFINNNLFFFVQKPTKL